MPAAGTMSDYVAHMVMNATFNDGAFTIPTNVYLALCKSAVATDDAAEDLVEPTLWTNYARELIPAASMGAAAGRQKTNTAEVDFGNAVTTADESLTHHAIVDTSSGAGNVIWLGTLAQTIVVQNGNPVKVPIGSLVIEIESSFNTP